MNVERLYLEAIEAMRNYIKEESKTMNDHICQICKMPDRQKPMAFRNKPWCCENHRKLIEGDNPVKKF